MRRFQSNTLEQQARTFSEAGKVVLAATHMRIARLLRWMWEINEEKNLNS